MKINRIIAGCISLGIASLSLNATASDLFCTGTVDKILNYSNGDVAIHTSYQDFTFICNTKAARLGVDPLVCATWTSQISSALTIYNNSAKISTYYPNSSYTCSTLPTYSNSPAPGYIGVGSW